jgi:hypothetical protein
MEETAQFHNPDALIPEEIALESHLTGGLLASSGRHGCCGEVKKLLFLPRIKPQFFCCPLHILETLPTELR